MLEMMFSYLSEDEIAAILVPFMDNNGKLILEDFFGEVGETNQRKNHLKTTIRAGYK